MPPRYMERVVRVGEMACICEDEKSVIRASSVCFLFARMVLLVVVLLQLVVFILLLRYAAKYSLVDMG